MPNQQHDRNCKHNCNWIQIRKLPHLNRGSLACLLWSCSWALQVVCVFGLVSVPSFLQAQEPPVGVYDPMKVASDRAIETFLFEIEYQPSSLQLRGLNRAGGQTNPTRSVPLKVYLPPESAPMPVVMFSHGLGGSRDGFQHGGEHWARRGYVAVFIQHPGSDAAVWRDTGLGQRMAALRDAASAQNLLLRLQDVKAVIDYLELIERGDGSVIAPAQRLKSRMDLQKLGMSGHSFGAVTTQMVSGQSPAIPTMRTTDTRIKAAVVLSPSEPRTGQPERAFAQVAIPWMLMTGTKDNSPLGDQTPETRQRVYPALPVGDKYQVTFDGGTHGFLGERAGLTSATSQPTTHAQATLALSTAFWDSYLKNDAQARAWLDGSGPQSILAANDVWQKK